MIVLQAELDLVHRGRRRQMWLPVERRPSGAPAPAPVEIGKCVSLQIRPFAKGTRVTVIDVVLLALAQMTDTHAKQQGHYGGAKAALDAFALRWGPGHTDAWMVQFALGDHTGFYAMHRERYLKAKGLGLTDDPKLAVKGEPAVTTEEELALAAKARERRDREQRRTLRAETQLMEQSIERLRAQGMPRAVNGELRLVERRLQKAERLLREQAA